MRPGAITNNRRLRPQKTTRRPGPSEGFSLAESSPPRGKCPLPAPLAAPILPSADVAEPRLSFSSPPRQFLDSAGSILAKSSVRSRSPALPLYRRFPAVTLVVVNRYDCFPPQFHRHELRPHNRPASLIPAREAKRNVSSRSSAERKDRDRE